MGREDWFLAAVVLVDGVASAAVSAAIPTWLAGNRPIVFAVSLCVLAVTTIVTIRLRGQSASRDAPRALVSSEGAISGMRMQRNEVKGEGMTLVRSGGSITNANISDNKIETGRSN